MEIEAEKKRISEQGKLKEKKQEPPLADK